MAIVCYTTEMSLETEIEGVLFYTTEPVTKHELASFFSVETDAIEHALIVLRERLSQGATRLVMTDTTVQLVIASELSSTIDRLKRDKLSNSIGRAGAETLAIILYRGPITRVEIDRIRGVNSTFIIRNLLIRGLVERRENPHDARSYAYAATVDLYNHLGISQREQLPDFEHIMNALDTFNTEVDESTSTLSE
jgi:segregation and condensation protein B